MRRIFILILLLPAVGFSQKINADTLSFQYSGVEYASVSARLFMSRARLYMQDMPLTRVTTKVDDFDSNVLLFEVSRQLAYKEAPGVADSSYLGVLTFEVKIICRDGKYKYSCYQAYQLGGNSPTIYTGGWLSNVKPECGTFFMSMLRWRSAKLSTHLYIQNMIAGLKAAMISNEIDPDNADF